MLRKTSAIFSKIKQYKTLVTNFSYLSALQILTLILPLITYPYLIRVLGKEVYGLVIIAQTVVSYLAILVNFGFNISATKEISIYRDNKEQLSKVTSSILLIRAALFVISFIILLIFLYFFSKDSGSSVLFILCMWICLYELIFPIWYFQGIEKMKYITYLTLISRLAFLSLIFLFIKSPEHYLRVPILNGIGAILTGIFSIYIIYFKHGLSFKLDSVESIKKYLRDGAVLFFSSAVLAIKDKTNILIIGKIIGTGGVAEFDLAVKIKDVLSIPINLMNQAIYPKTSRDNDMKFTIKITKIMTVIMVGVSLLIFPFTSKIVLILGGAELDNAVQLTNIMLFSIPILAISITIATNCINALGYYKLRFMGMILTTLVYILFMALGFIFGWTHIIVFYAIVVLLTYIVELFIRIYYIKKYQLLK